ncbi:PREDICTED: putative FBD-associated F-box protein At1g05080 [Camelina sativa]|uniref:FBD-associated F-box protein At1g05080 n=1 Tax=Camelina sativa TaxID=90675 RepID=A0ABM0WP17_CAMSA|nr:PREDICTED: putative FBD-associated F-box protein At1g05080 [Camelina sativa]
MAGNLAIHSARAFVKSEKGRIEDRISSLPDDLLVSILLFLPTKEAVSTMILSKRWRSIWTMLPELEYIDSDYKQLPGKKKESIWWFLDESLQLHKAPLLQRLIIELGPGCPVDVDADIIKWIAYSDELKVNQLYFKLSWLSVPIILPESLYVCDTLVDLTISDKILLDVPSPVCLPALKYICLHYIVYKDEDSLVRFLSGCHALEYLYVERHDNDALKNFRVEVPSLKTLEYTYVKLGTNNVGNMGGSLVIDAETLGEFYLTDYSGNSCLIENKPRLDRATISVLCYPNDNFMKSLSSVIYLYILLSTETVVCCHAINFSQLIECTIISLQFDWLQPFMCFLQNSPQLKVLLIDQLDGDFPLSFTPPSSVPGCLSTHLEMFEWKGYRGRNGEKEVVKYILANSKYLKRAAIIIKPCSLENKKKMIKELKSVSRVSPLSRLLFSPLNWIPWYI